MIPFKRKTERKTQRQKKKLGKSRQDASSGRTSSAPVARTTEAISRAPRITTSGGTMRIVHSELIATASATGANLFEPVVTQLNPGLGTLPWLRDRALGFQFYRYNSLRIEYKNRTSSTREGSVMLAYEYNVAQAPPATEEVMSSYKGCVEGSPWAKHVAVMDVKAFHASNPQKLVRAGYVSNPLPYDGANFIISTVDIESAAFPVKLGKIWVHYDVTFMTPQTETVATAATPGDTANVISTTDGAFTAPSGGYLKAIFPDVVWNQIPGFSINTVTGAFTVLTAMRVLVEYAMPFVKKTATASNNILEAATAFFEETTAMPNTVAKDTIEIGSSTGPAAALTISTLCQLIDMVPGNEYFIKYAVPWCRDNIGDDEYKTAGATQSQGAQFTFVGFTNASDMAALSARRLRYVKEDELVAKYVSDWKESQIDLRDPSRTDPLAQAHAPSRGPKGWVAQLAKEWPCKVHDTSSADHPQ